MIAASQRHCRRLARQSGSSFTFTYHLLPRRQRRAMYALYAFMRITDDLADSNDSTATKSDALNRWREQLDDALRGTDTHPMHAALRHAVRTYGVPSQHLHEVIDGVEMDLQPIAFETFDALYPYCYRVASAVGLCCIHIWGFRRDRAVPLAEAAGIAFQLTNILRDLGEDLNRGRVYLPRDELRRFDATPEHWRSSADSFREMMRFQVSRARDYYHISGPLREHLSASGAAIFGVMSSAYRGLLEAIEGCDFDVFTQRVRVGKWRKLRLLLGAIPVRWGLA